jgi:regulator of sirC expression with transglutaminase-like and TPR domain
MKSGETMTPAKELSGNQRAALVSLLADDDPGVYHTVRTKILSCGRQSVEWLRPHTLSNDPLLRRRAQELVHHFARQSADDRFLAFCLQHGEEFDLEEGAWLFAQTRYPNINVEGYRALLDAFAAELQQRLAPGDGAKDTLTTINTYLFEELGFAGNKEKYYDPGNSYLNRVLDRRTGNPLSLSMIYMLVSRRLRLPITGIGLPGHFICRYQTSAGEIYIDAFNRGKLLAKADCVQYLIQGSFSLQEDYLAPLTPRRLLRRSCGNVHQIYQQLGLTEEATRLQRYCVALARQM